MSIPNSAPIVDTSPGGPLSAIKTALRAVREGDLDAAACDVADACAMLGVLWDLPDLRDLPRPSTKVLLKEAREALLAGDEPLARRAAALALAMLLLMTEDAQRRRKKVAA